MTKNPHTIDLEALAGIAGGTYSAKSTIGDRAKETKLPLDKIPLLGHLARTPGPIDVSR